MRTQSSLSRLIFTLSGVASFAACSGSGGSPIAPVKSATSVPVSSGAKTTQSVTLVLHSRHAAGAVTSRAKGKRREYVSPSTTGVILTVTDATANTKTSIGYDVSPQPDTNSSCGATASNGTRTCTLAIPVTAGDSVTIAGTIYDAVPTPLGANPTAQGNALAMGTSAATTIMANQANTIVLSLEGIPARLEALVYGAPSNTAAEFLKVPSFQFHAVDYDGNPIDEYDATSSFASPLTVGVSDAGDTSGCNSSSRCTAFNHALSTTTTTIAQPSNGGTNDEMPQVFMSFEGQQSPPISNGAGDENTLAPYYAEFTASPNAGAVANSSQSGVAILAPLFVLPSSGLTLSGATAQTLYADQYMLPSGSAGYSVGTNNCGGLLTASAPSSAAYGAAFSIAGLTNGSCSLNVSDGVAADTIAAPISISGFATHVVKLVQSAVGGSKGSAVGSITATLTNAPATGDTVVVVVAQGTPSTADTAVATPANFTSIANSPTYSNVDGYAVFAKDVTSASDKSVTIAFPTGVTGALSYYIAEFSNTHASLASGVSVTNGGNGASSTTPTITPDAINSYLVTGASSIYYGTITGGDPYTASTGFAESFASGGASAVATADSASLDVQTESLGSPTAAESNTFTVTAGISSSATPTSSDFIFYLRPAS